MRKLTFSLLTACTVPAGFAAAPPTLDILIRNGAVYDGTGARPIRADVGIAGGKIVFVGATGKHTAATLIDATGLAVAPGFIDPHTHVADALVQYPQPFINEQFLTQGVTTIAIGADGGYAPGPLRELMADLKNDGSSTNYACYVGHNGVRAAVMKNEQREPSAADLDKMKALVREGMQMGCVGLSTGLMYEPGMFSKTDEVIALAKEVRPFDGIYDSHTRDPVKQMLASEKEAIDIGAAAGIPARLAHLKAVGLDNKGRIVDVIKMVEAEPVAGRNVTADQYPYDGAATTLLPGVFVLPERYRP
jgi:N-acyl-D-amino-acid deacylase